RARPLALGAVRRPWALDPLHRLRGRRRRRPDAAPPLDRLRRPGDRALRLRPHDLGWAGKAARDQVLERQTPLSPAKAGAQAFSAIYSGRRQKNLDPRFRGEERLGGPYASCPAKRSVHSATVASSIFWNSTGGVVTFRPAGRRESSAAASAEGHV